MYLLYFFFGIIWVGMLFAFIIGYSCLKKLNNILIFQPQHSSTLNIVNNADHILQYSVKSTSGSTLCAVLYNNRKQPSWDDNIIIYFYGNASSLNDCIGNIVANRLTQYGSIFLFDYSGYGLSKSTNNANANNSYKDAKSIWNFVMAHNGGKPNNVTLFAHSLGTTIATNLAHQLAKNNEKLPNGIILLDPLTQIKDVITHLMPQLKMSIMFLIDSNVPECLYGLCAFIVDYIVVPLAPYLVTSNMNTIYNIMEIKKYDKNYPIIAFHSEKDEIIPFSHSLELQKKTGIKIIQIDGSHNMPIFENKDLIYLEEFLMKVKN